VGSALGIIVNSEPPGPAAHLTILDILLLGTAPRIQRNLLQFTSVGAENFGIGVCCAVA
jgi:hypothetical protein